MTAEEREVRARIYRAMDEMQTRHREYMAKGYPSEAALVMAALDMGAKVTIMTEFGGDDEDGE